jgi:hypothetical protein
VNFSSANRAAQNKTSQANGVALTNLTSANHSNITKQKQELGIFHALSAAADSASGKVAEDFKSAAAKFHQEP